jgi:MFS family permease
VTEPVLTVDAVAELAQGTGPERSKTFASLKYPGTGRYFVGLALSMLGSWMQSIALSWLVIHELNGKGSTLALVGIFQFGPTLVLGAWAGSLADRFDKRRMMFVTQAALGLCALALAAMDFANRESLVLVLLLAGVAGFATAFDTPVRRSIIGDLVPRDVVPNAMSLNTGVITSSRVAGMAMGGFVTKWAGTSWCFLANGISYLAMIAALAGLAQRSHAARRPTTDGRVRDAIVHVWRTPALRIAMGATTIIATLTFNYQLTFPLLIKDVFNGEADRLGTLFAVTSVGSFVGAMISARRRRPTVEMFLVGGLLMGIGAVGAATASTLLRCELWTLPMGLGGGLLMAQLSGMLTSLSDPSMRGRVLALQSVVFLGSTPLGGPVIGFVADHAGARWAMAVGGLAALAATFLGGLGLLTLRRTTALRAAI